MTQATEPLTQLSLTVNQLQGALAAAERVFCLLDEPEVEPTRLSPCVPSSLCVAVWPSSTCALATTRRARSCMT